MTRCRPIALPDTEYFPLGFSRICGPSHGTITEDSPP